MIRGSSVGHNGGGAGLTVPNPRAQERVIRQALQQAIFDLLSERLVALNEPGEIEGVFFTQFVMQ